MFEDDMTVLERIKKYRCRTKRPDLIRALRLIEEISVNSLCDCNDTDKTSKPGYYCPTCNIYTVVHGSLGCGGSKTCPVMKEGRMRIKKAERHGRDRE